MNKEEKELVEGIKQYPTHRELCLIHVIERLDEELNKKDKVINLIVEDRAEIGEPKVSKEAIIDFYFKKAEEENE